MNYLSRVAHALGLLGDTGEVCRVAAVAEVRRDPDEPTEWVVDAIDDDGAILTTVFSGPSAEKRAQEYARAKYVGLRPQ